MFRGALSYSILTRGAPPYWAVATVTSCKSDLEKGRVEHVDSPGPGLIPSFFLSESCANLEWKSLFLFNPK